MRLGSGVVVAVAVLVADSCSSNSTTSLGTSKCCKWGTKQNKTHLRIRTADVSLASGSTTAYIVLLTCLYLKLDILLIMEFLALPFFSFFTIFFFLVFLGPHCGIWRFPG